MSQPLHNTSNRALIFLFISVFVAVVLAFNYLNLLSNTGVSEDDYLALSSAQALPLDVSLRELADRESNWISVDFPYHWRNQFASTRAVWYRLHVSQSELESLNNPLPSSDDQLLGIYIWRLNQTADIWFNGTKVGSGGNTSEPMARYWNSPLYFSVPSSLIQERNEILIKHYAQHSWGSMEPVIIGHENVLKPIYNTRYFIQHDIAMGLFVFVLVTGVFCFTAWFYRRQESQYLWFAIASVGLSFYCLNQFIRYLPIDADVWRWLSNVSTDLWACATFIFLLRSLNLEKPTAEKLVFAYLISGIPIYFYASFNQVFDINIYYHIGSLLIAVYGFYIGVACYFQTRNSLPAFYCCVLALVFAAGVHDTAMQAIVNNGWRGTSEFGFQNDFNFLHFTAPIIFLLIGASLAKRFIDSMNAADRLNEELEQRVGQARQELTENYQAIEEVLVKQSASEERERIYQDLHDDVGSKLLSLYYRLDKESDSTLAKSALEDLRDIVSRKSLESCSLSNAVQQWQHEATERVADAKTALSWHYHNDDEDKGVMLNELQHAHLRRMLREVLSNAILHSEGLTEIRVDINLCENELTISVSNDGVAGPVSDWKAGRGISNLRVRSRDLQGEFGITDLEESWVQASWTVPIETS